MKNKFLAVTLSILSAFLFLGRQASADTIDIVSDNAYAPFEFKDSDQTYKGLDVDLITAVAKLAGWDYNMTYPGFDAAVNAVQSGSSDAIMAGMTVTDERSKVFTFSDTYYDTSIALITTESNTITDYSQLSGKTVGAKTGTASYDWLAEHADQYGFSIKTFDTGDLMYNSLSSGSIDAAMDDEAVALYAINQGQDLAINTDSIPIGSFAFAVKKGSEYEYLIDEFNDALQKLKDNGTYDDIIAKWVGSESSTTSSDDLTLTGDADAKATATKDTYVIASDTSFAPFEYQDDSNNYTGFDMELIQAIADQQGFNIKINNVGFDAALNAVQSGQADAVIAGMTITDARKSTFDFSDAYYTSSIILAVKSGSTIDSYEDLKGKTVGAKTGTSSYDWLEDHADQYGFTITAFDEASTMYDSLNSGSVDAIMDDEAVLAYAIKEGRDFDTPLDGISTGEMGFAVKAGSSPELIEMFNNGLAALVADGTYDKLVEKYLTTDSNSSSSEDSSADETTIIGLIKNNYSQLLTGLGTTLLLTLVSFAIAMIIGIIFGMMSVSPSQTLRVIAQIFVDVIRGIPLMIVAAFIFWGIPNLLEQLTGNQSPIDDFVAATIALSLNGGAYIAEIVRGGIEAVPVGQMEASRSLGISYNKTMQKVILPQAIRLMLPNFINQFVISLKDTTIVSAIGLVELFQTGKIIIARNYQSFRMYAILAVMYLVIITILTKLAKRLEKRLK